MLQYKVMSKRKRIIIGVISVLTFNVAFIYGLWQLKPGKQRWDRETTLDIYADKSANGLAFYEVGTDENCVNILNEQPARPAQTYKLKPTFVRNEKPAEKEVTEQSFIYASAPKCSKPVAKPAGAEKLGDKGFVGLQINISKDGKVERGEVDRSSGFPELDEAALKQVTEDLSFEPCKKGDAAVACKKYLKYRWKL